MTVRSCAISSGGNPIKPSFEFDTRNKRCVGLTTPVYTKFIKKSQLLPSLFKNILTEVVVSSIRTLVSEVNLPRDYEYVAKSAKAGAETKLNWTDIRFFKRVKVVKNLLRLRNIY